MMDVDVHITQQVVEALGLMGEEDDAPEMEHQEGKGSDDLPD